MDIILINALWRGKINNLQINKNIKLEFLNLIDSSSNEESDYEIEQVYQHPEDFDVETSSSVYSSSANQSKMICDCKILNVLTKEGFKKYLKKLRILN